MSIVYLAKASLIAAAVTVTVACSLQTTAKQPDASRAQSIATDLPDTGVQGPRHLYWVNADFVFRGNCEDGMPMITTYCHSNLETMKYMTFKSKLDNGLTDTVASLREDVQATVGAMKLVQGAIDDVRAQIDTARAEQSAAESQLTKLSGEIDEVDSYVRDYVEQLTLIEARLAKGSDVDLAVQSKEMATELATLQDGLTVLIGHVPVLITRIEAAKADIEVLQEVLSPLLIRLTNLVLDHQVTAARLRLATEDLSVYQDTLKKLEQGTIYEALSDNLLFQKNRRFIKRFEAIFGDN